MKTPPLPQTAAALALYDERAPGRREVVASVRTPAALRACEQGEAYAAEEVGRALYADLSAPGAFPSSLSEAAAKLFPIAKAGRISAPQSALGASVTVEGCLSIARGDMAWIRRLVSAWREFGSW